MSAARSLARSPKLADGMTSETTEESGVNGCMSALPLGSGSGRRRFFSEPTDADEPCGIGQLKPGKRTAAIVFFGKLQPLRSLSGPGIPDAITSLSPLNLF